MTKNCIDILKNSSADIHKYLEEKIGVFDGTEKSKSEWIKAAKELQDHSVKTINDLYSDLGIKGFEKTKVPKETVHETTQNIQVKKFVAEGENTLVEGDDLKRADARIENIVSTSKTADEAQERLRDAGYALTIPEVESFKGFVNDRIEGKTDKPFSEFRNEGINKVGEAEPIQDNRVVNEKVNDIEKRRQEELAGIKYINVNGQTREIIGTYKKGIEVGDKKEDVEKRINAKYDKELSELPKPKTDNSIVDKPTEEDFKNGEIPTSSLDAEQRFNAGERIFGTHEMDETPIEIKSVDELKAYAPDQLISIKPKEVDKPTIVSEKEGKIPQKEDFEKKGFKFLRYDKNARLGGDIEWEVVSSVKEGDNVHALVRNTKTGEEEPMNVNEQLPNIQQRHRLANEAAKPTEKVSNKAEVVEDKSAAELKKDFKNTHGVSYEQVLSEYEKLVVAKFKGNAVKPALEKLGLNGERDSQAYDDFLKIFLLEFPEYVITAPSVPRPSNKAEVVETETPITEKTEEKTTQTTESQGIKPPKPPIDTVNEDISEGETVGISHAETESVRKKFGLNDYERNNATDAELEAKANEVIKEGYDPENLIRQMESGTPPTGVENFILKKYLATLEVKFDKSPSDENLAPIERLVKATDKIGSLQSEAFRTRKGIVPVDESLAGFFITEKEVNLDAPLTEGQKETVKKEYADISEAQQKYNEKIAALEAENTRLKAEAEVKKTATKKTSTSAKRTHEDFVKERREIIDNIREKLKKARGEVSVTPIPYAKELVTIAPDVARLVKNLVEEGVLKLSDIVADIHDSLKDNIKGLTKEDIHNIIAGEYNEKKLPKNEISRQVFELRQEAQLINKYEKLQNGIEPKKETEKIKRNQELEKLRKQIKEHDLTKLADYKSKTKARIEKLEEDLRTENFLKPESEKIPIILDKEALEAKDRLIKLKNERQFRILLHQHRNLSTSEKVITGISEVLNVPRALMTIVDYSALLRQGLIQSVSHPLLAAEATKKMLQAGVSQKIYDRWFYDLKDTHRFQLMEKSKLGITDSTNPLLSAREEAFMSNLAEKIPIIGKTLTIGKVKIPGTNLVKGSERAYSMFLNKMRVDVFNRFADAMESRGLTFENSPEAFKQMAEYVNNSTGRGSIGNTLNKIAPLLNSLFFSPRLIASRLNMLTYLAQPRFYKTVPKEVRAAYFKDMAKFIGLGTTVLALASLGGDDDKTTVETDPRSSDFGKIKNKNTRWDIWGGFQQYIRVATQTLMGEKKKANGKISKLDGKQAFGEDKVDVLSRFGRSKLAPVPSMALDLFSGRTQIGDKIIFDIGKEKNKQITIDRYLKEHLLPLTFTGLEESVKDQGVKALFTVGVPSVFGVGVQTFDSNKNKK